MMRGLCVNSITSEAALRISFSRFAEILMQEGFTGGFWAPPWDMGSLHQSFVTTKFSTPAERDLTMSWPRYRRPSLREFQYPVRMVTYSPIAFSLTLPGPTVIPLHEFIKSYFRYRSSLNPLMALLFIWTRSHRMDEFTTQTLALMIIRFMQVKLTHLFPCICGAIEIYSSGTWQSAQHIGTRSPAA